VKCEQWKSHCSHEFKCPQKGEYPKSYLLDNSTRNYEDKRRLFTALSPDKLTIITPSQWLAGLVEQSFLKKYPVIVQHNDIDRTVFKPTPSDFRERYGICSKFLILGVASPWTKRKGLDDFIWLADYLDSRFAIAVVGFFIGKNMIDSESGNGSTVTDKKDKDKDEVKTIDYNGVSLIIPNGYVGELGEDSGVLFKTSDKVYSLDFYDETISDFDSALLQMGAVSKGNKNIGGIDFNLYSYKKSNKTEMLYVVDTNTFRVMGFAVNKSYNYNEGIMKDVAATLGGNNDELSKLTLADSVKAKFNSKAFSTIYEFEEEEKK